MCFLAGLAGLAGAGTAAAGAGAAAAAGSGLASALQIAGLALSVIGPIQQGRAAQSAANAQAKAMDQQKRDQLRLNSIEEQRTRRQFALQTRQQAAQLAARGVSLDSPTALFLGQTAAEEMVFAGQSVRQGGLSEAAELSTAARLTRYRGALNAMEGRYTAVGNFITGAPKVWPSLQTGAGQGTLA